ncbi:alpha/beta fold hydrolase [Methylobacterium sp. WSM2598]|uniref:alpha/beta fold hydrolase n=1 Tax=Methylobacterium sp. WSM2598 TaxID=398261 RepID=UPI00036374A8|nr:alpha/beta hydrolase [Methylobacterium sp. WSM2598]
MARRPHSVLPLLARQAAKVLGLAALGGSGAWLAYSRFAVDHRRPLPRALPGRLDALDTRAGAVALYGSAGGSGPPLLLIHSINAAASAYEVRPLYLHYDGRCPVYALDLPGFGLSERARRRYTPDLMVEAIHAAAGEIRRRHDGAALNALALSLSAEYLARAALERPRDYRGLALISPTGFDARLSGRSPRGGHRGRERLRATLDAPPWGRALFDALVSRPSMRFFLEKTWGSPDIDEGLLAYGYASAHRPGAQHAPFCFIAGHLFPTDATALYEALDLPVLVIHGTRGDFVDYRDLPRFAGRRNWTVMRLPTGAFPHFEDLATVTRALDGFGAAVTEVASA